MEILQADIDKLYEKLKKDAQSYGYHLNPDVQFTKDLIKGLLINEGRYKYQSCPCRLSAGVIEKDRDIICPCDYRDTDIDDYGACYCGLYVNREIAGKTRELTSIPERRYLKPDTESVKTTAAIPNLKRSVLADALANAISTPVWRCKVCGYLCAREQPPETCPICKVKKDRFERFL
jgi:ferredoxin-thioredoxin reductase catalytic subunit/rubredoxin